MSARNITIALLLAATTMFGENTDSVAVPAIVTQLSTGTVEVTLPDAFIQRISSRPEAEANESSNATTTRATLRAGYRVQIFDDNNARTAKHEAQARRGMVSARFPEFRTYISFNSPYWRVKVGDFRTRSEAEAAMGAIRQAFPAIGPQLRIVRDRINP